MAAPAPPLPTHPSSGDDGSVPKLVFGRLHWGIRFDAIAVTIRGLIEGTLCSLLEIFSGVKKAKFVD